MTNNADRTQAERGISRELVLSALCARHPDPMTAHELCRITALNRNTLKTCLARLRAKGLIFGYIDSQGKAGIYGLMDAGRQRSR
jgi:DNA-binding IclR family transcriptional regulator